MNSFIQACMIISDLICCLLFSDDALRIGIEVILASFDSISEVNMVSTFHSPTCANVGLCSFSSNSATFNLLTEPLSIVVDTHILQISVRINITFLIETHKAKPHADF